MTYIRIIDSANSLLKKIQPLYEKSFPKKERRDFDQLLNLLAVDNMHFIIVNYASLIIGFYILWEFGKFNYIEHIAIDPLYRGKRYGSTVMKNIIGGSKKVLLLEVEPDQEEVSKKRIVFYERLGMKVCPFNYQQPAYRNGEANFHMLMMSHPQALTKELFEEYTSIIKAEVYERWR